MALPKRKFREIVLQILFSSALSPDTAEEQKISFFMEFCKATKKNVQEAIDFSKQVVSKIPLLDEKIEKVVKGYKLERISQVELIILRLLFYEMKKENLPVEIAISEGVRLSRKYGSYESADFIHAILDQLQKEEIDG